MERREVVAALEEIAELLEILGENPFKARAYVAAARALQTLDGDLAAAVAAGALARVKGIGAGTAEKIAELVATGASAYLDELRARVPEGVRELLRLPGLGPKRVREIREQLGVASLGELEYAAQSRQLETLPGFGAKSQANVLAAIAERRRLAERVLLSEALAAAALLEGLLAATPGVRRFAIAGEVRRRLETAGRVDAVVAAGDPAAAITALRTSGAITELETPASALELRGRAFGARVSVRAVPPGEFGAALAWATGSDAHLEALRAHAAERGFVLDESGLARDGAALAFEEEAQVYAALGLELVPAELREGDEEIEAAAAGTVPALLEVSDLAGALHVHSTYSDGRDTLRDMVLAARARGWRYVGITDHSPTARYANGLDFEALARQQAEIDRLQAEMLEIRILKGTECDILPDGSLDYPDEILDRFDFVVGSVHSRFGMSESEMTARLLRALEDPRLDVLGHPTGRLLLARPGYAVRMDEVLATAVERGVAVEVNAHPARLDLDWRHIRAFQAAGGWIAIDPDAHRVEGLDDLRYGVAVARKGWSGKSQVVNALPVEELLERFRARRATARGGSRR
jgi:DNA polymerase (family 10)